MVAEIANIHSLSQKSETIAMKLLRAAKWNYGCPAAYHITICTENRNPWFGRIVKSPFGQHMQLSPIGQIVAEEWIKTPLIRPYMNLLLDEFIVMPDHFHGILIIGENEANCKLSTYLPFEYTLEAKYRSPGPIHLNSTNKFGPQTWNLGSIIRGFKSAVTTRVRKSQNKNFNWQSLFHDRIIRDEKDLKTVRNYIVSNPTKHSEN